MTSIARAKQINEKKKIKNKKPMKAGRWANDERFAKNWAFQNEASMKRTDQDGATPLLKGVSNGLRLS